MGISKNIKIITGFKGMTLVELSKKSGVPINTIYTLTREDPDNATLRTIDRLAAALEVNKDSLLSGKDGTPEKNDNLEKEINLSEAIMKIIRTLSASGKKDWDYIEYLVTEAKLLDTETETEEK
ncbi:MULTISPECIES: helix-turn-helix domain-containing protein [unclassified Holdemanella]|uniref:helix-turn-helix domain-containing protein n=1 Tax=unclassified Holdemanella TaxID=2633909 RepID=UPI001D0A947F|nr:MULTISPECIES: helix-turn-helix transcriptional regulator [unclassified Holdemanella]MCB8642050.1 helix-turn-helix transcriptional regulator [Holdemanella sp. DFI.5.55]MCG5650382.1 helix-turn-helix transcriptional regulator [Holdemanella sp. DFI.5.21]